MSLPRETTPTRPTGDGCDPAGKASAIVTTLSVTMGLVRDGLAEIAINPEAFVTLGAALDVVAEIAVAVHEADRWLTTGEGRALPAIGHEVAQQAEQLDQLRASVWALADRCDASRPVLTLVAGGAS